MGMGYLYDDLILETENKSYEHSEAGRALSPSSSRFSRPSHAVFSGGYIGSHRPVVGVVDQPCRHRETRRLGWICGDSRSASYYTPPASESHHCTDVVSPNVTANIPHSADDRVVLTEKKRRLSTRISTLVAITNVIVVHSTCPQLCSPVNSLVCFSSSSSAVGTSEPDSDSDSGRQ